MGYNEELQGNNNDLIGVLQVIRSLPSGASGSNNWSLVEDITTTEEINYAEITFPKKFRELLIHVICEIPADKTMATYWKVSPEFKRETIWTTIHMDNKTVSGGAKKEGLYNLCVEVENKLIRNAGVFINYADRRMNLSAPSYIYLEQVANKPLDIYDGIEKIEINFNDKNSTYAIGIGSKIMIYGR